MHMELLKLLFGLTVSQPVLQPVIEVPKCDGREHKFHNVPITTNQRMQHRCQCGLHSWQSYARRWDSR